MSVLEGAMCYLDCLSAALVVIKHWQTVSLFLYHI